MLNRAALIVRPRKPYLDWAAGLDDAGISPSDDDEGTGYLIPSFEVPEEEGEVLKEIYLEVFERELEAWHTDESAWPLDRSFETFRDWFDIEMYSVVEDLRACEKIEIVARLPMGVAGKARCAQYIGSLLK